MVPKQVMSEQPDSEKRLLCAAKAGDTAPHRSGIAWLASGRGPQIVFAPEGVADISGAGNPPPPVSGDQEPAKVENAPPVERPEWLPETMWDAEKGFKKDDFDALVASKAERDSALASVPEKADGYAVKLPADFKLPEGFSVSEGESIIDAADPRVVALQAMAHSEKWTQTQFENVLALGVNMDIEEQTRLSTAVNQEREKLGSRAAERISAVTTWLGAKLGADDAQSLHSMMFTAKQVEVFERLMQLFKGDIKGNPGAAQDVRSSEISDEDYEKMTPTQKINYARSAQAGR